MLRARRTVFLAIASLVAGIGLAVSPSVGVASATAGGGGSGTGSMPAVNKGAPTTAPDPKPNSAPLKTAQTKSTATVVLSVQAPSPTTYGDTVQLTAVVNLAKVAGGGTVRFTDGGIQIGSSPVSATGVAQMSTSALRAGSHSFVATYTVGTTAVSSTSLGLSIAKRALHLYAAPPRWSRPVGAPNPPSYTVKIPEGSEGDLINGDTLATAVTGTPKVTMSAGSKSSPSIYPITLSALKSTNYSLVYLTAGYTVYSKDIVAGDTAPDITAPDQNGTTSSLSDLHGRVVLLDFSAVWCAPSAQLAKDIPTIASTLRQEGIQFTYLPVLVDGPTPGKAATQQNALNFFKANHLPADTHVMHVDGAPAALSQPLPAWDDAFYGYGAVPDENDGNLAYPTLAFIDQSGVVRDVTGGFGDGIDGIVAKFETIAAESGVTITSAPPAVTTHHDASIGFTSIDPSNTECSLDNGPFTPCTSPFGVIDLADGPHSFAVRITGGFAAEVDWTVINLDTSITGGPGNAFIPAFDFTGTGVGFVCWTGNETPYPCQSGWGIIDIPGGLQTFHVAAVDDLGNVDDTPATAELLFQPLPTITLVPGNANPGPSDSVTWTVTVTDASSGEPVAGQVEFYRPSDNSFSDPIDLDANGIAQITETGIGFGYDLYVTYLGSPSYGAEDHSGHVNVS